MTIDEISNICNKIRVAVGESRLRDAFAMLTNLSESMLTWELTSSLRREEESYRLMLDYASKGIADPSRDKLHSDIKESLLTHCDELERRASFRDNPTKYFVTLRYEGRPGSKTTSQLIAALDIAYDSSSFFNQLIGDDSDGANTVTNRRDIEELERRVFDRLWVSFPLSTEAAATVRERVVADKFPPNLIRLIVAALMLGQIEYHDPRRLELLLDIYSSSTDAKVAMAALAAFMLGVNAHRNRALPPSITERVAMLRDNGSWSSDVKNTYIELLRTRGTDAIATKMRDEVFPQLMNLRPDIAKKLSGNIKDNTLDIGDLEANPEWEDLFEKSGLAGKMREISELAFEGADVMMGSIGQMKAFPFFNDVVNWFRNFDPENSFLDADVASNAELMRAVSSAKMLCDSDKYSLAFSLSRLPQNHRDAISKGMKTDSDAMLADEMTSLHTDADTRRTAVATFLHDTYRFFHMFRRKSDFLDPMSINLPIYQIDVFAPDLDDYDTLMSLAHLSMRGKHWTDALSIISHTLDNNEPTSELYQQQGFCLQQLGRNDEAINAYRQAELIDSDNEWTMRRLAACYRLIGDAENALKYYSLLAAKHPDDIKLALNVGYCLLELGRDDEASKAFYKVEFLDEGSDRALRPLAWSLLRSRQFKEAKQYFDRILANNPTPEDYLNMGHLALTQHDFADAFNYYSLFIELQGGDTSEFIKAVNSDRDSLLAMGVDSTLIPLIIDQILYSQTH